MYNTSIFVCNVINICHDKTRLTAEVTRVYFTKKNNHTGRLEN